MLRTGWITIVSGLPRSGTSLMMSMLGAGGLPLLTDDIRSPDPDNPRGYFEHEAVKRTAEDSSWLKAASGHAVKVVYKILCDLPTDRDYRVVFLHRRFEEILASQNLMLRRRGAEVEPMTIERFERLFRAEIDRTFARLDQEPCFARLDIDYNDLIVNPEPLIETIDDFLGGGLDTTAMANVIDPDLYRQRH